MYIIKNNRLYLNDTGKAVKYVQSPNYSKAFKPEGIILHDTAGRLTPKYGTLGWFAQKRAKASAHFTVERDGTVGQSVSLDRCAWHAGKSKYKGRTSVSRFTFGIEIVNPGRMTTVSHDRGKAWFGKTYGASAEETVAARTTREHGSGSWMHYTEEQIESVTELCRALIDKFGLEFITTHWAISPGRKVDTNPFFPLGSVRSAAFGRSEEVKDPERPAKFGDARLVVAANMRAWPARRSAKVATLGAGLRVDVLRSGKWDDADFGREHWHLCRASSGEEGWIHALLVDMD